jgi:hypothetical protein
MKIIIVVHTGVTEEGNFKPGDTPDIREGTAEEWIKRGWAIAEFKEKKSEPEPEEVQKVEAEPIIETPEDDDMGVPETATLKRKKKR